MQGDRKAHPGHGVYPVVVEAVTKRYGDRGVVRDLSFVAGPGRITGFLGPNGSGKSTTMKIMLGLAAPDQGRVLIGDRPYADLPQPAVVVGALLESNAFHPGRNGRNHLRIIAEAQGLPRARVEEVLELVGLTPAAGRLVPAAVGSAMVVRRDVA